MAKKKLDGLDWDRSLDYEFEDPFSPAAQKKQAGVLKRAATSFSKGAFDSLKTPAAMRETASKFLPEGYGTAIKAAHDVYRQGEELHNIALKEMQPSLPLLRRITQRNLPKARRYLPKTTYDRLNKLFKPPINSSGHTPESADAEAVRSAMAEVFGVQMEETARSNAENRIERQLNHTQAQHTARGQLSALQAMQQGMANLVSYQDEVTYRYQRKSIELQTRHYMVARDSLRLQVDAARRMDAQMAALVENTAMPDIAKQTLRHSASMSFRQRLMGSAQDSAGKFASRYFGNISKKMKDSVKQLAMGSNDALGMADMGGDDAPLLDILMQQLGGAAATGATNLAAGPVRKYLTQRFPGMAQQGGRLDRLLDPGTLPLHLNRYAKSTTNRTGLMGAFESFLKSSMQTYKLNTTVGVGGLDNADKPEVWDKLSRRSLVEIIPGWLSRIEHNTARVLDPKAQLKTFNHDKRTFTTVDQAAEDMRERTFGKAKRANVKASVEKFIDDMLGDTPITTKTRRLFMRQVLMDSANGEPFDPRRYTDPSSTTPELTTDAKLELANVFAQIGQLGGKGGADQVWLSKQSKAFNGLDFAAHAPIHPAGVYRQSGQRDVLEHSDWLVRDGLKDNLNMSRILDLVESADVGDVASKEKTAADNLRDALKDKARTTLNRKKNDVQDLYVEGGTKAVLSAQKLRLGQYLDTVTGQVITSWDQIRGAVRDLTTNDIVADTTTLMGGLVDRVGKAFRFNVRTPTQSPPPINPLDAAPGPSPLENQRVRSTGNAPRDVVNRRGTTLLAGWKIKAGHYRDALTKKVIKTLRDISGPVIDDAGNTVVTASDVVDGLSDVQGRPITGAAERMREQAQQTLDNTSNVIPGAGGTNPTNRNDVVFAGESPAFSNTEVLERQGQEQVELLKVIASILEAQGPNGGGEGQPIIRRGFLDSLAIGGAKGAWAGLKGAGKATWWWSKSLGKGAAGAVGLTGRLTGGLLGGAAYQAQSMLSGIKDIYVNGKRSPVVTVEKLRLNHYQDVNTRKRVKRVSDITGPVVDITSGETVIDQADFEAGLYVKGKTGLTRLATKAITNFGGAVVGFYGNVLALPFKVANAALKAATTTMKWAFNKQVDVYVKGESSPRLKAEKMKTGRYYNINPKKMGKVVSSYDDIYGEIKELAVGSHKAQADDKTVLYEEEITNPGLVGRWGTSLRTPAARLIGAIGGAAVSVIKGAGALFGGALKGYGKLFGGMMGLGGGLIGAPFKFLGSLLNPFEKHGAKQVEWLEKIFQVIDDRLPAKKLRKGSWQYEGEQREAEVAQQAEEQARQRHDGKFGVGGLLSWFKNKGKSWFGNKDEEEGDEDEDDDGGNTTVIAGGGGDGKEGRGKTKGKKGGWRRNREARRLRNARATRGRTGMLSRLRGGGLKGLLNPKALLTGAVITGGTGLAMDALGADEKSTTGKVINGVGDAAGTASNMMFLAQLARSVPWLGSVLGGAGAAGAGAAGAGAAGAAGTAAAGTAAAGAGVTAAGAAGGAAAATAGAGAAVVGAPVWVPVAIGAAAVAAVGSVGYFAHKQMKYGKLTPIRRFRYLQYGIAPGDAANNKKIFQLEELLFDHVGEKNGGLEVLGKSNSGGKDITMKEVYELFDLEDGWFSDKGQQRTTFNIWYAQRFKPIFLTWVKALRAVEPRKSLLEADEDMESTKQQKVLAAAWGISKSLYSIAAGPIDGERAVTNVNDIEDAYQLALKEAGKSTKEKSDAKFKDRVSTAVKWMGGPLGALAVSYAENKREEEKAKKLGTELTAKKMEQNSGQKMLGVTGAVTATAGVDNLLTSTLSRLGKVTALAAVRYRAYGLSDLETDRVRALAALEAYVFEHASVASSGKAYMTIDAERMYGEVCGLFGLTAANPKDRVRWAFWYGRRFLPVCLAYMQAVRTVSATADLKAPERVLKADQLMVVAQSMLNTKDPEGRSIWHVTASPWSETERLNSDSNAISGSLLALKAATDKKLAVEEKLAGNDAAVKQNKGMLSTMLASMKTGLSAANEWLGGAKNDRNWLGKTMDGAANVASNMWQGAKNAYGQAAGGNYGAALSTAAYAASAPARSIMGALQYGPGLSHPGQGTGGDINALPNVPSNSEIASMAPAQRFAVLKPLFDAVAKMTGVDANMLYAIASIESTFNPGAKAPTSSASGLFQFINGTWANMLAKYGKVYGLSPSASPFDPKANALMGAMFLKENFNYLKKRLGRGVNETDMYMAHFMGAGGAANFLSKDPNLNAVQLFPKEAKANPWIFYQTTRQGGRSVPNLNAPMTVGAVYQLMQQKVNKAQAVYGGRQQGGGGKADFSSVSSSVSTTANKAQAQISAGNPTGDIPASNAVGVPTTTTTTANGPTGGVGAVQKKQMAPPAAPSGTNSLTTGGGYAAAAAAGMGGMTPSTSAPSITSAATLDATAVATAAADTKKQQAIERDRQARSLQLRAVEAQSQMQQQTDQAQMARMGELLEKSLEVQRKIATNTEDTVTHLREILRRTPGSASTQTAESKEPSPVAVRPTTSRPFERSSPSMPVSVRFAGQNG